MKRIVWALPLAAAWVLVCGTASAADAAAIATTVADHIWLTVIAGFLPPIIKALNEGTLNLPTVPARIRLLIIGVLSAIATSLDLAANGASVVSAVAAFVIAAGPSLLIELIHAIWGGWKGASVTETKAPGGGPGPKIISVPPPRKSVNPPPMAVLVLAGALLVGCAAKAIVCPVIKLASDVCPLIMVELPDGTVEAVPKEQIAGLAMQARASRMGSARDAGPE